MKLMKEKNFIKNFRYKKNKNIEQKLFETDFYNFIIVDEKEIIIKVIYKEFILEAEAVILTTKNFSYIAYWKGNLKVNTEDKIRSKNLLFSLSKFNPHQGWLNKSECCLTFSCNQYSDLFLYLRDNNLYYSPNLKESSFKNYEWLLEELKRIVDKIY